MAGITFGAAKDSLRTVVDNGVDVSDARVLRRTNEATQELLAQIIPVNGMIAANVVTDINGFFLLPKEFENAIDVTLYLPGSMAYGSADVIQGWYDIVNQFTYVDPSAAHDNPLIDHGLSPDPGDSTILRRYYEYPGLGGIATVHVVGAKRYIALTGDTDSLIIQNVPALKLMIQAIERRENNDPTGAQTYKQMAMELLTAEVKKFQLDPRNTMRRKSNWEADLRTYNFGTMGWTRARLALEVPGAQMMGKEEITRVLERAELRLMEMGLWKDCVEEFTAQVVCGHVVMPERVESILAADLNGHPIPVRSIFFKYLTNGPGDFDTVFGGLLEDEGDIIMNDGYRRHKYRLNIGGVVVATLNNNNSGGPVESDTITADSYLYIGTNARLKALPNGLQLEVKDGSGNWILQSTWTE